MHGSSASTTARLSLRAATRNETVREHAVGRHAAVALRVAPEVPVALKGLARQPRPAALARLGIRLYKTLHYDVEKLLADAPHIAQKLRNYTAGFSPNIARCRRSATPTTPP